MKKILSNILIIMCFCSFCFFAYKIGNYIVEEKMQKKMNEKIIDEVVKKVEPNAYEENNEKENSPLIVDFQALKNKNSDIIAWLYSEGTPINYPIVQAKNNDYYLRRLIDGTYNRAGTIFMDYRNSKDFSDYNTIIYGHNMKNESMFGTLINYEKQDYYNEHKEMFLFTEQTNYKIELFSGYTTSSENEIYNFPKSNDTNEKIIDDALKHSTFNSEVEVSKEDKIITFSTCSYNFEDARYVLLGVLKELK